LQIGERGRDPCRSVRSSTRVKSDGRDLSHRLGNRDTISLRVSYMSILSNTTGEENTQLQIGERGRSVSLRSSVRVKSLWRFFPMAHLLSALRVSRSLQWPDRQVRWAMACSTDTLCGLGRLVIFSKFYVEKHRLHANLILL